MSSLCVCAALRSRASTTSAPQPLAARALLTAARAWFCNAEVSAGTSGSGPAVGGCELGLGRSEGDEGVLLSLLLVLLGALEEVLLLGADGGGVPGETGTLWP